MKTIAFKMFRANMQQYRLFILCNLASVAISYSFIAIAANKPFKDPTIVDSMVSSNIYAPTALVVLFSCLFIPYTHSVFMKVRSKEYGILLTLGMTESEARIQVLIENMVLCVLFLLSGLGVGTLLSLFFWGMIRYGIGIHGIQIKVSLVAYKVTALYVGGVFLLSLAFNLLSMLKSTILEKIKYTDKTESGGRAKVWLCAAGVGLTVASFAVMVLFYHIHSNIWFVSLLVCVLGSVLIFFNGGALIDYYKLKRPQSYLRQLFLLSDIKYYYRKNRTIFFVTSWIFFAILFFMMFSLITYPNFTHNAVTYHPYHMVYTEITGSYRPLGDKDVRQIAESHGNRVIREDSVKFVRNELYTIFDVADIDKLLAKRYSVQRGSVLYVYPYDVKDGYEHVTDGKLADLRIDSPEGARSFSIQDSVMDPLFGQINSISDRILLVNTQDYSWFTTHSDSYKIGGFLHAYNFADWRHSKDIVEEVAKKLHKQNGGDPLDRFYQVSSRTAAYRTAHQSSNFLTFVVLYACLLLYFSAIAMIHFKLKMESMSDNRRYRSLHRIGLLEDELKTMVDRKIRVIFGVPFAYAAVLTIAYSYYTNSSYGYGLIGLACGALTVSAFLLLHAAVYRRYSQSSSRQATAGISQFKG
ncbi:FtsX-like permease family protein [Paenibacillus sabinae]|uniref:ABC transporter permease n=1 Tax=Paenibacillus sabinae T27 TaxID=1268072 RepID=X4ZJ46_9BACL|nr:FtsX-like permease family protein [Paenibacillus sabinae]AHV99481.1 ABC transporter permease [Paenibacillus sabinae T27]